MSTNSAWETVKKHSRQLSGPLKALNPSLGSKFSKFHDSTHPISLKLDGNELVFEDHVWRLAFVSSDNMNQYYQKMKETNKALQEENQLLKFKLDILLDMLSTTKLDLLNSELELQKRNRL